MTRKGALFALLLLIALPLLINVGNRFKSDKKNDSEMDIKNMKITKHEWNQSDSTFEQGIDHGVSAAFEGRLGKDLIMAGGCNFPQDDPISPDATKRFYNGIYAADTVSMNWRRIGSLPEAMAYGVTAPVGNGLVMIGGTTAEKSLSSVYLLSINDSGAVEVSELPSLPVAIDNAAAAAIGRKVYVAGGNVDGKPSNRLFMIDLGAEMPQWHELKNMPGNNRVQPSMASGVSANGEPCLYLFGGFAPRFDGNEPTLNTDGLVYTPSSDSWKEIYGPKDEDGNEVSLGGGCAATLTDGRMAFAGGVNRRIFLDALTDQAPDYLQHPIEWYRFNPVIFVFDPSSESWQRILSSADAARAGAGMVAGADDDFYIIGGELKPRIRSSVTLHLQ